MQPSEYKSARPSHSWPVANSGGIKAGVPINTPALVMVDWVESGANDLANPKSKTFTRSRPEDINITLEGLRSRWMIFIACAPSRASHTCMPMRMTRSGLSFFSLSITSSRVRPCTSSMTKRKIPSLVCPKSNTPTALGCDSRLDSLHSRKKRLITSGLLTNAGVTTLMATSRPTECWLPRYTAPMPPWPSFSVMV